ncbi:hypothetical protein KEM56_007102 [Ascosphaera pollenicola]|nr:hypothetical protein KEM56_007102 [Ascosphaera pollenicola]
MQSGQVFQSRSLLNAAIIHTDTLWLLDVRQQSEDAELVSPPPIPDKPVEGAPSTGLISISLSKQSNSNITAATAAEEAKKKPMSVNSHVHYYRQAAIFIVKLISLFFTAGRSVSALPSGPDARMSSVEHGQPLGNASNWVFLTVAAALVLAGGIFAGLTIALMGQDEIYLQVLKSSGDDSERKHATRVLDLLNKGKHWILVTLLLSNVITNETLPIVLDRSIGGGWPAIFGSTLLIVIFGEIIPQSICVSHGLTIGAWMAPFVLLLMRLMSPIAYPTALLLDRLLGKGHGTVYKKAGLKTLVTLHKTLGAAGEQLNSDEVTIISAVLDLKEKPVGSIMTPMENVFTMSVDSVLDEEAMDLILSQGYSRIPIHTPDNPGNFIGMLLVKMLITYDPEDCKQVKDFALATLPETRPETSCLEIVNFFQEGKSHMVIVSEFPGDDHGALGVVTLEDVIEELIGEEIIDESDVFVDVHKAIRRLTPAPKLLLPKGLFVPSLASRAMLDHTDGEARLTSTPNSGPLQSAYTRRWHGHHHSPAHPWPPKALMSRSAENLGEESKFSENDIREHLKRLGPSNPSTKPLQTRISNVKIKPGATDGKSDGMSPIDITQPASAPSIANSQSSVDLKTSLLDHSTDRETIRPSYGAFDEVPISRRSSLSDSVKITSRSFDNDPHARAGSASSQSLKAHTRVLSRHSSGSHGNASSPTESSSLMHSHRATSSGAITEQIINVNGIRKVVLQIGSSEDYEPMDHSSSHSHDDRRSENRTSSGNEGSVNFNERRTDGSSPFAPSASGDGDVPSDGQRRRRRRRRKHGASRISRDSAGP